MAQISLGQVAIVSKGAWSSSAQYAVLNTVTHNGGSFMAIAANSNVEPGVTTGWASSWVATAKGVKTVTIEAVTTTTARAVVTYSDGTTTTGATFNTSGIPNNSITTAMIQEGQVTGAKIASDTIQESNMADDSVGADQLIDGSVGTSAIADDSVTGAKLASTVLPTDVGFKYGTANPPTPSDISNGQVYFRI